jgi:hypothetical protein
LTFCANSIDALTTRRSSASSTSAVYEPADALLGLVSGRDFLALAQMHGWIVGYVVRDSDGNLTLNRAEPPEDE